MFNSRESFESYFTYLEKPEVIVALRVLEFNWKFIKTGLLDWKDVAVFRSIIKIGFLMLIKKTRFPRNVSVKLV